MQLLWTAIRQLLSILDSFNPLVHYADIQTTPKSQRQVRSLFLLFFYLILMCIYHHYCLEKPQKLLFWGSKKNPEIVTTKLKEGGV